MALEMVAIYLGIRLCSFRTPKTSFPRIYGTALVAALLALRLWRCSLVCDSSRGSLTDQRRARRRWVEAEEQASREYFSGFPIGGHR